ncbi:MAG TPA: HNH endonuclease signature motif containing protein [Candidatus Saccharimonadales bacterium]|nr:HNH endonuclease signature motif containing protein [Candidatus Saccharimonadales bacterium]
MPKNRSWTDEQLIAAVQISQSYRNVLRILKLIPAGGNYVQIKNAINKLEISTAHFTGKGWNEGMKFRPKQPTPIDQLLVENGTMQSYSLKRRLFQAGLKKPQCEQCGWAEQSQDGRIPVELDHINGNPRDNRLQNLRILCPNCHSLQPTHRGKNKRVKLRNLTD